MFRKNQNGLGAVRKREVHSQTRELASFTFGDMFKRRQFLRIAINRNDIVTGSDEAERHGAAKTASSARHHST